MKKYITKKEALRIFIKEHPNLKVVNVNFLLKKQSSKNKLKLKKEQKELFMKIDKLRKSGMSLREISLKLDVSHQWVNIILKRFDK